MKIEIVPVLEEEKTILARLIELYEYDFTEFENNDVNSLGLYGYSYLDYYWTEDRRFPYFIKVDGKLAGFVMVCDFCYVSKDKDTLFVSEFFIMKKYRKQGIGKFAANEVFNMHKGKWELTLHPRNLVSLNFWNSVIEECSGGNYKLYNNIEDVYDDSLAIAYIFEIA
ncbi:GNAT family N-acetyltransferase [Mycoplasmatota bacterium WC44]